jgi:hypothetical protein
MNCTHSKRLIPLYVGGDLKAKQATVVREHIEKCEHCRNLAVEFEESQRWLRGLTAPEFGDAAFENLRAAVREDIARIEARQSLFDMLLPVWNLRSAIAASAALVLLTAGLLFYTDRTKSPESPITKDTSPAPVTEVVREQEKVLATGKPLRRQKRRRPADVTNLPVSGYIALNNHFGEIPSQSELTANQSTQTNVTEREMMRIEMQTADPNIRIIWFVPKDEKSATR